MRLAAASLRFGASAPRVGLGSSSAGGRRNNVNGMGCPQEREVTDVFHRERWALTYRVGGDVRYISHHDTLRMFERALARAALPVRFTQGFNPHPKLSLPLPRPVGVASDCETAVIEFVEALEAADLLGALGAQMPEGIELKDAQRLAPGQRLQPASVTYRLRISGREPDAIDRLIDELLTSDTLCVERIGPAHEAPRTVDIRPYLAELCSTPDGVEFTLLVTGGGSAKPAEVAGLFGFDPKTINHEIQRLRVAWAHSKTEQE